MTVSPRRNLTSALKLAELIFFPSLCELCSSLLEKTGERVICRTCRESLIPWRSSFCLCCGRFFDSGGEPHFCSRCLEKRPPYTLHRSCGQYSGKLRDVILLFKYRKLAVLGKVLAEFAHRTSGEDESLWINVDAVIPVPLHPRRKKQRGFNQARVIARELAKHKGIDLIDRELVKLRNTPPQSSLEAEERQKSVKGAFGVNREDKIREKIVLLVDDVCTTGSTLRECSSILLKAGAREVRALTVAQA